MVDKDHLHHQFYCMRTIVLFELGYCLWTSGQTYCSPTVRAQRVELESRRDGLIIAQGKRGTSAALGGARKMISSFFPSGLARRRRAKPEGKKEAVCGGFLPRAAASAALPWAIILLPLRGAGKANKARQATPVLHPFAWGEPLARRACAHR